MESEATVTQGRAARLEASLFGVLAGFGGLDHGIGEVLQGNAAPGGIVFNSWAEGPIAEHLGGEPAMSLVPNFLLTGTLTILVSLAVMIWAAAFVQRRRGGLVLILLSILMLLVGGGFAPPILGILAGVAGLGINSRRTGWRTRGPDGLRRGLARLWPWLFGVSAVIGAFLFVGSTFLVVLIGFHAPDLFTYSFLAIVVILTATIVAGSAYDAEQGESGPQRGR
jgi:hypothetical protein